MQYLRKILLVIIVLLLALYLGRHFLTGIDMSKASADEIIAVTLENSENITSIDSSSVMDLSFTVDDETVAYHDLDESTTFTTTFTTKSEGTISDIYADETITEPYLDYADESEEIMKVYSFIDDEWVSESIPADARYSYSVVSDMRFILYAISDPQIVGTETINGEETTKLEGTVSGDYLADTVYNCGILGIFNDPNMILYLVPGIEEDLGEANLTIWISNDQVLPVRYQLDLSPILPELSSRILRNMDVIDPYWSMTSLSVNDYIYDIVYSNVNQGTPFTIPAEARIN